MNQNALYGELRALLNEICGEDVCENAGDDLLETGLLDSLARVEWLERLEDRFGTAPQPTQIPPEVWHCAQALLSFCADYYAEEESRAVSGVAGDS